METFKEPGPDDPGCTPLLPARLKTNPAPQHTLYGGGEHMTSGITPTLGDPQAPDWHGLAWSEWQDFDEAHRARAIPTTPGIYRFRARGEPGLLYIGESGERKGRRARLGRLARGMQRHPPEFYLDWRAAGLTVRPYRGHYAAPYMRQCKDEGCQVEVSWAKDEHPDKAERRAVEERLIQLHREVIGIDPPIQHGGTGVAAYLGKRHANGAFGL